MTVSDEARRLLAAQYEDTGEEFDAVKAQRIREGKSYTLIDYDMAIGAIEAALSQRPSPHDEGVKEQISPAMAEVVGIVLAMNTAWVQREEAIRSATGFDGLERAANLMDQIVGKVPELQRKLLAALNDSAPKLDEGVIAEVKEGQGEQDRELIASVRAMCDEAKGEYLTIRIPAVRRLLTLIVSTHPEGSAE